MMSHLSRQVWGKAANPLHMFQRSQLQHLRVNSVFFKPTVSLRVLFPFWVWLSAHGEFYTDILRAWGQQLSQSDWNVYSTLSVAEEGWVFKNEWLFEVSINQQVQHQCAGCRLGPFLRIWYLCFAPSKILSTKEDKLLTQATLQKVCLIIDILILITIIIIIIVFFNIILLYI